MVHEIAHQWFGDSVTERDWDDVWLSEGFATYFALLFTEHDEGRDAFAHELQRSRATVLQLEQKLPDTPVVHRNLADMTKVLNNLVYQKGGWVLHMLRQEVGNEHFGTAIREYYRRYRDANASTADLRAVFEQVSGKPLDWFFTQWLNRPGAPKLEGSWRYDAARKQVEITLTQSQPGDAVSREGRCRRSSPRPAHSPRDHAHRDDRAAGDDDRRRRREPVCGQPRSGDRPAVRGRRLRSQSRGPAMTQDAMVRLILASRVYDVARTTPLEPARRLSQRTGNQVLLKREDLQPIFTYKLRGAYNRMAHLTAAERARGVIAASAGNHAQGVAYSARHLGISALIVMPQTTPAIKVDAVRELGADVELAGDSYNDAAMRAATIAAESGRVPIHAFDDELVIAGQGTVAPSSSATVTATTARCSCRLAAAG